MKNDLKHVAKRIKLELSLVKEEMALSHYASTVGETDTYYLISNLDSYPQEFQDEVDLILDNIYNISKKLEKLPHLPKL